MGIIFSNLEETQDTTKILKEIADNIDKRNDITIEDIKPQISTDLTPIKEHNDSPIHYSNLKHNNLKFYTIEKKEITQYPKSELTTFKKLKRRRFYGFFV